MKVVWCGFQDLNTGSESLDNRPELFKSWELGCLGFVAVGLGRAYLDAAEPAFLSFSVFGLMPHNS